MPSTRPGMTGESIERSLSDARRPALNSSYRRACTLAGMVSRPRLRSFFTALGLYVLAALLIGYFGVNAYTGNHGLRARQDFDQQIGELTTEGDTVQRGEH